MSGTLYLVGTPIGNLGDISRRCAETLAAVDFIAAEDTRVSRKLLNHLDIHKSLVSYHEHNSRESGLRIVQRLLAGESCALVTDAGMPAISDPGEDLVRLCAEAGVEVAAVPGPSAAGTALALSGLPTGRFTFEGFLAVHRKERLEHLASLREEKRTMVFYEAPHKLAQTLEDLCGAFGEERRAALCREMTKLHEEVIRCSVCGEEISRDKWETDALGHDWNEVTYTWTEDNSEVTASRTCKRDETHVETETVKTTSEVTKEATYNEEGELTYTASILGGDDGFMLIFK